MDASTGDRRRLLRIEGMLSALLRYGALFASGWIALGIGLGLFRGNPPLTALSDRCLAIGLVLLIALPVVRVALMTGIFLLEGDYRFAAISGAVLAIITLGFLLGVSYSHIHFL